MLGLWRQERSASGLPARPGAVGPGRPAPIVLKVIPWKHPFEKAGDQDSLDHIFMHIWYTRPTITAETTGATTTVSALGAASTTAAPELLGTVRRAPSGRSRSHPSPRAQTEAVAHEGARTEATTRCWLQRGTAERFRSHAARLAAGGRPPAAASDLSLPKGLGSVVHQLGCTGMRSRSRRGRQVAYDRLSGHGWQGVKRESGREGTCSSRPRTLIVGVSTPPEPASGVVPHWARRIFI